MDARVNFGKSGSGDVGPLNVQLSVICSSPALPRGARRGARSAGDGPAFLSGSGAQRQRGPECTQILGLGRERTEDQGRGWAPGNAVKVLL